MPPGKKILIKSPQRPFPNYKWRWATFQPTESLNSPPIFLGVLRAFKKFQHQPPSSQALLDELQIVENETNSKVDLVRDPKRNLVRNSGQYWKALGLLQEAHGQIIVSPFGQLLADGKITQVEFATTVVKTLELPNRRIDEDTTEWDNANLRIKPLQLILAIMSRLQTDYGRLHGYLTPFELVKIVIPLAGDKASIGEQAETIFEYREGHVDISGWPDCAPRSNDKRMAREFLLFLANYGFCSVRGGRGNENEMYFLSTISRDEIIELNKLQLPSPNLDNVVKVIKESQIPANVERKRVTREVLERPYQAEFRKNVLIAYNSRCLITGVNIENVLEASHIIPVKEDGSDLVENGLCLRSDIHQLFDSGHLRLLPNGQIILSETAVQKHNYAILPKKIKIPDFVNADHLHWRTKYY